MPFICQVITITHPAMRSAPIGQTIAMLQDEILHDTGQQTIQLCNIQNGPKSDTHNIPTQYIPKPLELVARIILPKWKCSSQESCTIARKMTQNTNDDTFSQPSFAYTFKHKKQTRPRVCDRKNLIADFPVQNQRSSSLRYVRLCDLS